MSYFHFIAVSIFYAFSRVMDSKWGGKTETINMKLNVEQVQNKMTMILKQMTHMHNFRCNSISLFRDIVGCLNGVVTKNVIVSDVDIK